MHKLLLDFINLVFTFAKNRKYKCLQGYAMLWLQFIHDFVIHEVEDQRRFVTYDLNCDTCQILWQTREF